MWEQTAVQIMQSGREELGMDVSWGGGEGRKKDSGYIQYYIRVLFLIDRAGLRHVRGRREHGHGRRRRDPGWRLPGQLQRGDLRGPTFPPPRAAAPSGKL